MKQPDKDKKSSGAPQRGQQLSDVLASKVAKKEMTFDQASKVQKKKDSTYMAKHRSVGKETQGSSQNLASKRTYAPAVYKLDRNGNIGTK